MRKIFCCSIVSISCFLLWGCAGPDQDEVNEIEVSNKSQNKINFTEIVSDGRKLEMGVIIPGARKVIGFLPYKLGRETSISWSENDRKHSVSIDTSPLIGVSDVALRKYEYKGNNKWAVELYDSRKMLISSVDSTSNPLSASGNVSGGGQAAPNSGK